MRVRTPLPVGAGVLLGACAGGLVGLVDGTRAALVFGVPGMAIGAAVALSIAVDVLVGWVAGAVVEALTRAPADDALRRTGSLVTVGLLIARAALRREESRGGHFRDDFPQHDDIHWLKHVSDVRV